MFAAWIGEMFFSLIASLYHIPTAFVRASLFADKRNKTHLGNVE
jgi:hypothetical protein